MAQYDGSIRINTQINTKNANAQLMTLENRIKKTADKIASLRSKMDALKNAQVPTKEYEEISAQIKKSEAEFNKLLEKQERMRQEGKDYGAAWDRLNAKMEEAGNTIRYAKGELQDLVDSGKAFTTGSDTKEYADLGRQIEYLESDYSTLIQRRNEFMRRHDIQAGGYERLQVALEELQGRITQIMHPVESIKSSFSSMAASIKEEVAGVAASIINGINHPFQTMRMIASKAISTTSKLLSVMASIVKKTGKAISGIVLLLKKASSSMLGFGKSAKSTNNMLNTGFKAILKYGLGIRSFYILVNKFRTAVKEGFKNLAQYSGETNVAISSLMSALTQLKNSLATAFNPILTAIAPALTTFINMVSKAVTYVGMLIAALTGQKTFTKAVAAQEDYAASLKDTSKNTKDAKKETDKYLSGLDEIARFSDGKDSEDDEGGYKAPTPGEMFETVPIEASIKNLADKIRELIKSEDWEGLGEYLAEGINSGLQKVYDAINWDNVGPRITYFVNAFTKTFNSLVDNLDWDLLGRTIGTGINTIINELNLLIEGIDWENLGKKISVGFRGLINELDWGNLGELLGNKFMIQWNIFTGFVDDMWRKSDLTGLTGWSELGKSLAKGLNGLFGKIDLGKIGKTLGRAITGLFQSAIDFAKTFDWISLGKNIANGINNFLENFDAATVAQGASDVIKGLLDALITAVEETDWELMGEKVAEFLANVDWGGIASRIFELLGAALGGLGSFLGRIFNKAFGSIKNFFGKEIEEAGGDVFLGICRGIAIATHNINEWIYDNIFKPFIDGFKKAFGIHSPSTVMQEQGNFIMEGLLNGVAEMIDKVVNKFGEIKEKILTKWEEVKTRTGEKWDEIKSNLSEKWEKLKTDSSGAFENIRKTISDKWSEVKTNTGDKWSEIKEKVSNKWDEMKKNSKDGSRNIKEKVSEMWDKLKTNTSDTWDEIKKAIKAPINAIIGFIQGMINGIITGMNTLIQMLNKFKIDIPDNPLTGAVSLGLNIPEIDKIKIPPLATGAVIPPNKEFLAVLGDQKHGTNIEAPLSTIEEASERAVEKVLNRMWPQQGGSTTYNFSAQINRRVLFDEIIDEAKLRQTINSRNPFELT